MYDNQTLVQHLMRNGSLQTKNIIKAFSVVDRSDFVSSDTMEFAYEDRPLPIGYGQTISQPTTVAMMLEWLQPREGQSVLDVGSGSGYTTALLAAIVGPNGSVTARERIEQLVYFAKQNLSRYEFENIDMEQSGTQLGVEGKKFDAVLVSASANRIPKALLDQLKNGGRMVVPVENSIVLVKKDENGAAMATRFDGFVFVPLIEDC